ncbi:hypothetical protein ACIBO2_29490 [Nonomuraea sp. NPDC050022]|uniref:hypothetical protein n=1 Tax=Nonomuraea sp. NPDC050022 TaxID=3364358 RepID=UPI003798B70C
MADEPDGATILTGISIGAVDVTVQLAEGPPPRDLDSWEEIVEVSIESTSGSLIVCGLDGDLPKLPNLAWQGEGFYRLRVHARGRDTMPDGSAGATPVEHYLIIVAGGTPAGHAGDLRDLAVHDRRELVDDDQVARLGQGPRDRRAERLPLDRVRYGRSHAGGEDRPTAPSSATMSLMDMPSHGPGVAHPLLHGHVEQALRLQHSGGLVDRCRYGDLGSHSTTFQGVAGGRGYIRARTFQP